MVKPLRIYLDTSVPNAVLDPKNPHRQSETKAFWTRLDQYDVFISQLVLDEIDQTPDPQKQGQLQDLVKGFHILPVDDPEVEALALAYVQAGVIPVTHIDDATHIAVASVNRLDAVVSWNYQHMVKLKTKREVNAINLLRGYPLLEIVDPSML